MGTIGYGYGSEWQLLQYLGRRRGALTAEVQRAVGIAGLRWFDGEPFEESGALKVREHKGLAFLQAGDPIRAEWESRWPQSGNVQNWDAVGHAQIHGRDVWVLLEAKAHLGELRSSCGASKVSRAKIREVLDSTRLALGVTSGGDWTADYYQAANRIALLHFLRDKGIDARVVFLYFTGDRTDLGAPGRTCPVDEAGWGPALAVQKAHLGLDDGAAIHNFIHSLFLPAIHSAVAESVLRPEFVRRSVRQS